MQDSPQLLFEQAKAYFQQANENGESLYDLLANLVQNLQENVNPSSSGLLDVDRILHNIEEDSFRNEDCVKPKTYENLLLKKGSDKRDIALAQILVKLLAKRAEEVKVVQKTHEEELEKKRKELEEREKNEEEEEEEEINPNLNYLYTSVNGMSDIIEDNRWLEIAGIGLEETEAYRLQLSIASHITVKQLRRARFFGKIYGTEKNYYIIESEHLPFPEESIALLKQEPYKFAALKYNEKLVETFPPEEGGRGVNQYSYWVCNTIGEPWVQLPDLHPKQIRSARLIKKSFTGNLTKRINSYPAFPGNEANYLRAQIARIVAGSLVAPAILSEFEVPEPEDESEALKNPNPIWPTFALKEETSIPLEELPKLESWVHLGEHIRLFGRCKKYHPPSDEEPEEEEENPDLVERLRPISSDEEIVLPGMKKVKKKKVKKDGDEDDEEPDDEEPEDEPEDEDDANKEWKPTVKIPAWTVRTFNKTFAKENVVVLVASKRWPGAYCYACRSGKKFGNVYIGYGLKETFGAFTPMAPPPVQSEMKDPVEQKDPSARNEKRVLAGDEPIDDNAPDDENPRGDSDNDNDDDDDVDDE